MVTDLLIDELLAVKLRSDSSASILASGLMSYLEGSTVISFNGMAWSSWFKWLLVWSTEESSRSCPMLRELSDSFFRF